jgi:hypothetical protein
MSEVNYFKKKLLYKIMWHNILVIWQLIDDVTLDNW